MFLTNVRTPKIHLESFSLAFLVIVLYFSSSAVLAGNWSFTTRSDAMASCTQMRSAFQNGYPQPPPSQATLNYLSSCMITTGYFAGYNVWYSLKASGTDYYGTPWNNEDLFVFPGAVTKNTGSGVNDDGSGGKQQCAVNQGSPLVGDPINAASGNKYLEEEDLFGGEWLTLRRFYNSEEGVKEANLGPKWRHSFDRSLESTTVPGQATAMLAHRPDGKSFIFIKSGNLWNPTSDSVDKLTNILNTQGQLIGYGLILASGNTTENYDLGGKLTGIRDQSGRGIDLTYSDTQTPSNIAPAPNLLLTVADLAGRELQFTYTSGSKVDSVALPDGALISYSYQQATGNLAAVSYPEGGTRNYAYNESGFTGADLPNHLTCIVDENGDRFEETVYDNKGRAIATHMNSGVEGVQITYSSATSSTVQYAQGNSVVMNFVSKLNMNKVASLNQNCAPICNQEWASRTYDWRGFPDLHTDFKGNKKQTAFDTNGLLSSAVDAVGTTAKKTVNYTWNTTLRKPLTETLLNAQGSSIKRKSWIYNTLAQEVVTCEVDLAKAPSYICSAAGTVPEGVRRNIANHCTAVNAVDCPMTGLLLSHDGPRTDVSDVSTYQYYLDQIANTHAAGDLQVYTNAVGHQTTFAKYDAAGRATEIIDANGIVTELSYSPRGYLNSRAVAGRTTNYEYDGVGQLIKVIAPDGSYLAYEYDAAHRLMAMSNNLGERTEYTRDLASNITRTEFKDVGGTLRLAHDREYDTLGRLHKVLGQNGQVNTHLYDPANNPTNSSDVLGNGTIQTFDALNRLSTVTDALNGVVTYTYNAQDHITSVTDAKGNTTSYDYDGLGNLLAMTSPDTGTTTYEYDAAGNKTKQTDARGVVTLYTYDALNRLTGVSYPATPADNATFTYDSTANGNKGVGRLTGYSNDEGATVLVYDDWGNLIQQTENIGTRIYTTEYTYDTAGRITQITYPSERIVYYTRDATGQVTAIETRDTAASPLVTVVSAASYEPFGPLKSLTYGDGSTTTITYDTDYRVQRITTGTIPVWDFAYTYDGANNIVAQTDQASTYSRDFSYDALYRVITDDNPSGDWSYQYDQNGNRTQRTWVNPGSPTTIQYLTYPTDSNRLTQVASTGQTRDAAGNLTAYGNKTYTYNDANRLQLYKINGQNRAFMLYNAMGQRIGKTNILYPLHQHYDQSGHYLGTTSYNGNGTLYQRYDWIYLGDRPVAQVRTDHGTSNNVTGRRLLTIHTDHLNTPRAMADSNRNIVWRWDGNAFGQVGPNEDPDGNGTNDILVLRFPGQFYDSETGLYYNYYRDYDPEIGRYIQSDPIGITRDYSNPQMQIAVAQGINLQRATEDGNLAVHFMGQLGFKINTAIALDINHLYGYALQNPVSFSDRFGLDPVDRPGTHPGVEEPAVCPKPPDDPENCGDIAAKVYKLCRGSGRGVARCASVASMALLICMANAGGM